MVSTPYRCLNRNLGVETHQFGAYSVFESYNYSKRKLHHHNGQSYASNRNYHGGRATGSTATKP